MHYKKKKGGSRLPLLIFNGKAVRATASCRQVISRGITGENDMEIEIISKIKPSAHPPLPSEKKSSSNYLSTKSHQIILEKEKQEPPITDQEIQKIIQQLKDDMQQYNRRLQFNVNKEINRIVVKVIDKSTEKVIKEIPPVEIQHMIASIRRSLGLLVDKQI